MSKEYIERETVIKCTDILDEYLNDYERLYFVKKIKEIPTADVVEVVRCKDCKFAWVHPMGGTVYCGRDGRKRTRKSKYRGRGNRRYLRRMWP